MSGTPGNTSGYGNTGFNGGGLSNYNGQQQTGNQQFDPRQTIGWGDQRLSVGGPAPGPNMDMAARNAPGAPPWLQQQMAGYYAAPFMTANGTSDFPRWGQSPMSYNPQYNPQGQQPNYPPQGQPQQPQQPSNPYSPTQSAPNAPAPPVQGHPASRTQPLPVSMGDPGGGPFSSRARGVRPTGPSSGEATTPAASQDYWAAIANAALPGVQQGQRLPAWLTGGLNDARQVGR